MPRRTQDSARVWFVSNTWLSHSLTLLPRRFFYSSVSHVAVLQPHSRGLGSSPFARRYLGNLFWFLFPGYLDGSLHPVWLYYPILFRYVVHPKMWVTPFGDPRINAYVLLPVAFRSLSRPSSPYSSIGIRHRPIFAWPYYSFRFFFNYLLRHSAPFLSSLNFMTR